VGGCRSCSFLGDFCSVFHGVGTGAIWLPGLPGLAWLPGLPPMGNSMPLGRPLGKPAPGIPVATPAPLGGANASSRSSGGELLELLYCAFSNLVITLSSSSPNFPPISIGSSTNMTSLVVNGGNVDDVDGDFFFDVLVASDTDGVLRGLRFFDAPRGGSLDVDLRPFPDHMRFLCSKS